MAVAIQRTGFGQVELNQVIGIIEAKFIDMTPVDNESVGEIVEQGRFLRQAFLDGKRVLVNPGHEEAFGPFVMVYNEEYFYDERDRYHKDFAMKAEDYIDGIMVPRCIQPEQLDKLTTNCFVAGNVDKKAVMADENAIELAFGDEVGVNEDGYFCAGADAMDGSPKWRVIKEFCMPDMQPAVKIECVED